MDLLSSGEIAAAVGLIGGAFALVFRSGRYYAKISESLNHLLAGEASNRADHAAIKEILSRHENVLSRGVPPPEVEQALERLEERLSRLERHCWPGGN